MIDTNNTIYPKDKPLGVAALKANFVYFHNIAKKSRSEADRNFAAAKLLLLAIDREEV